MKLSEIMVIRNDNDEPRLKILQVDDDTLARLTPIRGNLYKNDSRLRLVKDFPKHEPELTVSLEVKARAEASWLAHCMTKQATPIQTVNPELKTLSLEEQIRHDWRCNPGVRKEFISLASYTAYCRAVRDRRAKIAGGCVVR